MQRLLSPAWKSLRRRPGFALTTIALLALGIGANAAVFSVVHAVLLRPLPYVEPDRLAFVWGAAATAPGNRHDILTGDDALGVMTHARALGGFALLKTWQSGLAGQIDFVGSTGAARLQGALATANFFEVLGARAAFGRTFGSADGDAPVAVLSDRLWRSRFGADPSVLGRSVTLAAGSGRSRAPALYTIVGVLPPDFRYSYPLETELYVLMPWTAIRTDNALEYQMVARLAPGATFQQAQRELSEFAAQRVRTQQIPADRVAEVLKRTTMFVEPMTEHMQAEARPGMLLLAGVAVLLLVIACVNLGLLLLARNVDRRGELGLRAALGAGTGRIVAQLTAESALLSVAGGAAGVAVIAMSMPVIRALMPPVVPRVDEIGMSPAVLAFSAALMALTTIVCGVGPAWLVLRRDLLQEVRRASVAATSDRALLRSRRLIVVGQVAIVMILLVGSALLLRSFWRLQHIDLGFAADDVVTMEMRLLGGRFPDEKRIAAFQQALLDRVRAMPGVVRAGLTTAVPMRGVDFRMVVGPKGSATRLGNMRAVDPEYFRIMQLRLLRGRVFDSRDTAGSERVTVVSEAYGRMYFGDADPVGQALSIDDRDVRIVGVVGDVRYADAARDAAPAFYLPSSQQPIGLICLVVQPAPGMRAAVVEGTRAAVRAVDPEQPVQGITTIGEIVSGSTADRRFYALATGAFAGVALLLAVAGVFGVVSRTVSERRRELAICMALGAEPGRLLREICGYGLVPVSFGVLIGLTAAAAGSRLLQGFLFQVAPTDAATYAGAAGIILMATIAACALPARRLLRFPPMTILRD